MSYDNNLYPITTIENGSSTYTIPTDVPCPSSYSWKLSDVSASDAGRTENAIMHRKYITRKRHLELEWQNVTRDQAYKIIRAFSTTAEYISIRYWDVLANGYVTGNFYSGDRESPTYNMALGIQSSVKFNVIEI